ncbi:hypothetical protein Terro_4157 [Terriglobus roseus DSM 18391]|uniref:Uncharacterized protein n=1 Tax=Terriglobus roseus (strain DSM 18391 / NRRL B-41598 / KBS 63) TaxID=926566 RepID=I3ZM95_TERRK|nr:hypothetical protein [Terriglobus roseus]AFL90363.1 hypothetical protein Terro_4157 [Terriglobus roseus DSM 18391]
MKEPTGKTWVSTMLFTWISSMAAGYFSTPLTWREALKTFDYSVAFATLVWLFALARWNRAIIKN